MTIEEIILRHDRRGIARLRQALAPEYCHAAAAFVRERLERVLILTGFYVAGTAETDGPPGALALARCLQILGGSCTVVTDRYCAPLLHAVKPVGTVVEVVPIADEAASSVAATALLARFQPTLVIAVERCGRTESGVYRNMHGVNISAHTARLDALVQGVPSLGIGDGGNEIGMGLLTETLSTTLGMDEPCCTATDQLVLAAVSNWGAYGLIAALSLQIGRNLLPGVAAEHTLLQQLVQAGAIDGVTGRHEPSVDGHSPAVQAELLTALHAYLQEHGLPALD